MVAKLSHDIKTPVASIKSTSEIGMAITKEERTKEMFGVIAPKVADRPGGYTRVLHTGFRQGDAAEMALIELVDFNEAALASAPQKAAKKSTRRSRAKKAEAAVEAPAEAAAEAPKAE